MKIYAHRGWHGRGAPENGMEAFRRAAEAGFGIETDLRTDGAGRIVLFHDRVLDGAPVEQLAPAELDRRAGFEVPTLDALLRAGLTTPLNLEVKTRRAWLLLRPRLRELPGDVLLSSFVHRIIHEATETGLVDTALLTASAPSPTAWAAALGGRLRRIVWAFDVADRHALEETGRIGFQNIVYGPTTAAEHASLAALPCEGIITDHPEVASGAVGRRNDGREPPPGPERLPRRTDPS